jgi:hypothetical protein
MGSDEVREQRNLSSRARANVRAFPRLLLNYYCTIDELVNQFRIQGLTGSELGPIRENQTDR